MQLYRLAKEKYIRDLSGTGARLYGGRWNRKGVPALYTSEHRSLAILEFLVHASLHTLPPNLALMSLSLPDDLTTQSITKQELSQNWQTYPAPDRLAKLGTEWLLAGETLILRVPSVVVPDEWNVVINPTHSNFGELSIETASPFDLDSRFLSGS